MVTVSTMTNNDNNLLLTFMHPPNDFILSCSHYLFSHFNLSHTSAKAITINYSIRKYTKRNTTIYSNTNESFNAMINWYDKYTHLRLSFQAESSNQRMPMVHTLFRNLWSHCRVDARHITFRLYDNYSDHDEPKGLRWRATPILTD